MPDIDVTIVRGSPTEAESEAIRAAIAKLIGEDRARAAASGGPSPWILAARLAGANRSAAELRGRDAWRVASRLSAPTSHLQPGRGDAR